MDNREDYVSNRTHSLEEKEAAYFKSQLAALEAALIRGRRTIDVLKEKVAEIQDALKSLLADIKHIEALQRALKEKIDHLQKELEALLQTNKTFEEQDRESIDRIRRLEDNIQELIDEKKKLEEARQRRVEQKESLEEKMNNLIAPTEKLEREIMALDRQIKQSQREMTPNQNEIRRMLNEIDKINNELANLEREMVRIDDDQIEEVSQDIIKLTKEIEELKKTEELLELKASLLEDRLRKFDELIRMKIDEKNHIVVMAHESQNEETKLAIDLEFFTPAQIIVQEKIKDEIKMLGIAISEDLLESIFYEYFVLDKAWDEILDKSLGKKLPSDQLDKLKMLKSITEDLAKNIASEPQNLMEVSEIYSSSLEETMIVEKDPVVNYEENPASNEEDNACLLIEELEGEKVKVESLLSTQNIPNQHDLKEIAKFCDKLASVEQINSSWQPEIKWISEKFIDQIVKFAESMAEVIKNQFWQQKISAYIYAFAIIENPFKVLAYLLKIPKLSNSYQLQGIFWSAVEVVVSKVIDSQEAALNIISNFYQNGSERRYNEALTCHLKFLEEAKWIDDFMKFHSCQQFSSEIKKEIFDCVEKFTKDIKKIDIDVEKIKWIDQLSAIESKVKTLLPLKPLLGNLEDAFTKFYEQVQDKKAILFANIMKEFSMERRKHMEPNSLNISKAVTALEGLRRIEDCYEDAKYEAANTALDKYLKGYFRNMMDSFRQLKAAIDNVMNPENDLKNSLEVSLDSIRKNSKISAGYLDKLKSIRGKCSLLDAFIPEEEVDSFLSHLRNFRKRLAIEIERLCSQKHSIINFHSKLQIMESLMELDRYISSDDESLSQLYLKHSHAYEGRIQKIFTDAMLDLTKSKFESLVATMKELEDTSPELFSKLKRDLKNYINDLVKKIKEETVFLSPSLSSEQSKRIANRLETLKEAKIHIPKEYLTDDSFYEIIDCIKSAEENISKKISNYAEELKTHAKFNSDGTDSLQSKSKKGKEGRDDVDDDYDQYDDHEDAKPAKKPEGLKKKPLPPKKPLTAFFLFKNDIYEQVKKENPDLKMTELTKIISERWNDIGSDKQSEYERESEKAKEKYDKEVKAYVNKYGEIENKKRKEGSGDDDDDDDDDEDHENEKPAKKSKGSKKK